MNRMLVLSPVVFAACVASPAKPEGPQTPNAPAVTAYVHGRLAESDMTRAQAAHDQIAAGGETAARANGDQGHHVLLGTGEPDPAGRDEFLAIDEWTTLEGAQKTYGDPGFQAAFGSLFAQPVAPALFERRADWHNWGDLKIPSDGTPVWVMTVKGHLAKATEEENRAAHDAVAAGFQAQAEQAGDIAHVPNLAIDDPRVFFNVDVSVNHDGMLAVLTNPDFQQAFGALFDAPPEVHIYQATNWKQW